MQRFLMRFLSKTKLIKIQFVAYIIVFFHDYGAVNAASEAVPVHSEFKIKRKSHLAVLIILTC